MHQRSLETDDDALALQRRIEENLMTAEAHVAVAVVRKPATVEAINAAFAAAARGELKGFLTYYPLR
jgi:hypothetical protein